MEEKKPTVLDLQKWKPEIESSMEGLRLGMGELKSQVVLIAHSPVLAIRPEDLLPILPSPEGKLDHGPGVFHLPLGQEGILNTRKEQRLGPSGHHDELNHQGKASGERFPSMSPPGNGKSDRV